MSDDKTKTLDERSREEQTAADNETEDDSSVSADTDVDTTADDTEIVEETDEADAEKTDENDAEATSGTPKRGIQWSRVIAFGLLPALALALAAGAGYLKWLDNSVRSSDLAALTSIQAAKDGTIALLSYQPDTVEQQLGDARNLLTGEFRESYTSLTTDVVIPGAKQKQISAVASVPAAASVSATPSEAVVLLFVNQTVTVGQDPPTDTASSVRVTLEKVGDRWLISKFDPV